MEKIPENNKELVNPCPKCGTERGEGALACLVCKGETTLAFNYLRALAQMEKNNPSEKPKAKESPADKTRKIEPSGPTRKLEE